MISSLILATALLSQVDHRKKAIEEFNRIEEQAAQQESEATSKNDSGKKEMNLDEAMKIQKIEPPVETVPQEAKAPTADAGYLTKLSNAYGCFREFMSAMLAQRFKRDSNYVACSTQGAQACADNVQRENSKVTTTLGDQFRSCLNRPAP